MLLLLLFSVSIRKLYEATENLTSLDHQNCGDWHIETGQRGIR